MKYGMDTRAEAVRYFELGFANKAVGGLLGIPHETGMRTFFRASRQLARDSFCTASGSSSPATP